MAATITIRQPDDMHVHLRSGNMLKQVVGFTADTFSRAIAMGNLTPPVVDMNDFLDYFTYIMAACKEGFRPTVSAMLVNRMTPVILAQAHQAGLRVLKWIPGGTSTGSGNAGDDPNAGVSMYNIENFYPVLDVACGLGITLSCHCELLQDKDGQEINEAIREQAAIPIIRRVIQDFPRLKIVIEHVSSAEMVNFVKRRPDNVAATITAHHLVLTKTDVYRADGSINGLNYCKPVAKTEDDRWSVIHAATSGDPKFFFGSDSAPHPLDKKLANPPAAGIFSAPVALPILAQVFEDAGVLGRLNEFTSYFGARFYGLPTNKEAITLKKEPWVVPELHQGIPIFLGGQTLEWQIAN